MKIAFICLLLLSFFSLSANEGMWLLPSIESELQADLQVAGLDIEVEEIYHETLPGLHNAIVLFNGNCSGALVSPQGLLFTNHHCAYSSIQALSSLDTNYLADGFWAQNLANEIPIPDLSISLLESITDVSSQVLEVVNDSMDEQHYQDAIAEAIQQIKAKSDSNLFLEVKSFFSGNAYYLFAYREYNDVRLVGAPPSSIGRFGGDTDNWMWPRHTGDFTLLRAYTAPDGTAAPYHEENIPLVPAQYLKISLEGFSLGDYVMIMGYPGSTSRYMPSWGVKQRKEIYNQSLIDVRAERLGIWYQAMMADPLVNIKYASKYVKLSNYYKNSIAMNKQLEALNVLEQRKALESAFQLWADSFSVDQKYSAVLPNLQGAYTARSADYAHRIMIKEALYSGIEINKLALKAVPLFRSLSSRERGEIKTEKADFKEYALDFYKNYDASLDKEVALAMLKHYHANVVVGNHPKLLQDMLKKHQTYEHYIDFLFEKSLFTNKDKCLVFIEKPKLQKLKKDPLYAFSKAIREAYYVSKRKCSEEQMLINRNNRLFEQGLQRMLADKRFYPDANMTMRLTYGSIEGYISSDSIVYNYYTTLSGLMAKEDTSNVEFLIPPKLKDLYHSQDYGHYANGDSTMGVCFLSNNDITGGNSGSPVMNAQGELLGLAFDSNWEGVVGDIIYEPNMQRVISVDVRYILFIIDKYAGAGYLLDEMEIVP